MPKISGLNGGEYFAISNSSINTVCSAEEYNKEIFQKLESCKNAAMDITRIVKMIRRGDKTCNNYIMQLRIQLLELGFIKIKNGWDAKEYNSKSNIGKKIREIDKIITKTLKIGKNTLQNYTTKKY